MEGLLSEFHYFEPNFMQLSVMCDYDQVFATGQRLVQGGRIVFIVRGVDELSFDLNNSKLEIMSEITLENGNDLTVGAVFGLFLISSMLYSCQLKWNWDGYLSLTRILNSHVELSSKMYSIITSLLQILGSWPRAEKRIWRPTVK